MAWLLRACVLFLMATSILAVKCDKRHDTDHWKCSDAGCPDKKTTIGHANKQRSTKMSTTFREFDEMTPEKTQARADVEEIILHDAEEKFRTVSSKVGNVNKEGSWSKAQSALVKSPKQAKALGKTKANSTLKNVSSSESSSSESDSEDESSTTSDSKGKSTNKSDSEDSSTSSDSEEGSSDESDSEDSRKGSKRKGKPHKGSKKKKKPDKVSKGVKVPSMDSRLKKWRTEARHLNKEYSANDNKDSDVESGLNEESTRALSLKKSNKDTKGPMEFQDYESDEYLDFQDSDMGPIEDVMQELQAEGYINFDDFVKFPHEDEESEPDTEGNIKSTQEYNEDDDFTGKSNTHSALEKDFDWSAETLGDSGSRKNSNTGSYLRELSSEKKSSEESGSGEESSESSDSKGKSSESSKQKEVSNKDSKLNEESPNRKKDRRKVSREESKDGSKGKEGFSKKSNFQDESEQLILNEETNEGTVFNEVSSEYPSLIKDLGEKNSQNEESFKDLSLDKQPNKISVEDARIERELGGTKNSIVFDEDTVKGTKVKSGAAPKSEHPEFQDASRAKPASVNKSKSQSKTTAGSGTKKAVSSEETSSEESSDDESSESSESSGESDSGKESSDGSKGSKSKEESRKGAKQKGNSSKGSMQQKKSTVLRDDSYFRDVTHEHSNHVDAFPSKANEKSDMKEFAEKMSIAFDEDTVKGTKVKSGEAPKILHSEHPEFHDVSRANPASVKKSKSQTNTLGDADPKKGSSAGSGTKKEETSEGSSESSESSESSGESDSEEESSDGSDVEDSKGSKRKGESRKDAKKKGGESSKGSMQQKKSTVLRDDSYFRDVTHEHSNNVDAFPSKASEESDFTEFADSTPEEMSIVLEEDIVKSGAAPKKMHSENLELQDGSRVNPASVKKSTSQTNTLGDADPKKGSTAGSGTKKEETSSEGSSESSESSESSGESDSEESSESKEESRKDAKQKGKSSKGSAAKQKSGKVLRDDSYFRDEVQEHPNNVNTFPSKASKKSNLKEFADSTAEKMSIVFDEDTVKATKVKSDAAPKKLSSEHPEFQDVSRVNPSVKKSKSQTNTLGDADLKKGSVRKKEETSSKGSSESSESSESSGESDSEEKSSENKEESRKDAKQKGKSSKGSTAKQKSGKVLRDDSYFTDVAQEHPNNVNTFPSKANEKSDLKEFADSTAEKMSIVFDAHTVQDTKVKSDAAPKKLHSEHLELQDGSRANPASVKKSNSQTNTLGDADTKKGSNAGSGTKKEETSSEGSSESSESSDSSGESDSEEESSESKEESRKDGKQKGDSSKRSAGEQKSGKDSIQQKIFTVLKSDLKEFADPTPDKMSPQDSRLDSFNDEEVRQGFSSVECSKLRKLYSADSKLEINSFRDCHSEESMESYADSLEEEWDSANYLTEEPAMDDMFSPDYVTKEGITADYITEEESEGISNEDPFVEEETDEDDLSEGGSSIHSDIETGFLSEGDADYFYDEDYSTPAFDDMDNPKPYLTNRDNVDMEGGDNEASSLQEESNVVRKLNDNYARDSFEDEKHSDDEAISPTIFADCVAPSRCPKDHATVPETGAYCHSRDTNSDVGFAAMAPYNATVKISRTTDKIIPKECKPEQIWMIIRAGTFSAKKAHMKRFRNKLPQIRREILDAYMSAKSSLCAQDLALLRSWRIEDMDVGPKGSLTPQGKREIDIIANSFKDAFPRLLFKPVPLGKKPSPDVEDKPGKGTRVAFAPTPQTYESAVVFLQGLYGNAWGHVGLPIHGISILQFGDHCSKYINEVLMKPKKEKPYQAFKKGKDMKGVLARVSYRVGFNITVAKVRVMYNACRYQKAWNPNVTSPWCVVFTQLDLKILEYWEDLRMHFDHGHVHPASNKQACVLAKDILMNFRQKMSANHSAADAIVYFINAEAIISFTALLDLYKDPAPLKDSFNPSRLWKTSRFAGSGSNYAFILSSCTNNRWWVSATLNEAPFQLPGCTSPFGCSWDTLVRGPFGAHEKCDLSKICGSTARNMWNSKRWHTYYIENNWM